VLFETFHQKILALDIRPAEAESALASPFLHIRQLNDEAL
jgi:hypothetical protein